MRIATSCAAHVLVLEGRACARKTASTPSKDGAAALVVALAAVLQRVDIVNEANCEAARAERVDNVHRLRQHLAALVPIV